MIELTNRGYEPDKRFPGQTNRGTFPLDADFAPDGQSLVLDGAVKKNSRYGIILFTISATGNDFKVVHELIEVTPDFSNNHNYSQTNPLWL